MLTTLLHNTRPRASRAGRRGDTRDKDFWWWEDVDFRTPQDELIADQTDSNEAPTAPPPFDPEPPVHSMLHRF